MWWSLGKKLGGVSDLIVAELDVSENEVEDLNIEETPTILFYAKTNKQGVKYTGERDLNSMYRWVLD